MVALCTLFIWLVTLFPWLRKWVLKRMPQAGEGPSRAVMEGGYAPPTSHGPSGLLYHSVGPLTFVVKATLGHTCTDLGRVSLWRS